MSSINAVVASCFSLVIIFGGTYLIARSFGGLFAGAPFVPVRKKEVDTGVSLAQIQPGEMVADLGCGDGRVLLGALAAGADVVGYEISPVLWLVSWLRVRRFGARAHVLRKNFFSQDLSCFDVIFAFQLMRIMAKLSPQLLAQCKPNVRIVSFVFRLPAEHWVLVEERGWAKLYKKKTK